MISTRRAMILSGLVMPGLGQWVMGFQARGALIMLWIFLLLIAMFVRLFFLVYNTLYPSLSQFQIPADLIREVHTRAYAENWWLLAIIVVIWLGSVVDVFFIGRKAEEEADSCGDGSG